MAISRWKKFLYYLAIILSVVYLIWRIGWTIPWEQSFWFLLYAIILWVCEVVSNLTAYITIIFRMLPAKKKLTSGFTSMTSGCSWLGFSLPSSF